jgi:hypothetical protein
MDVRTEMVALYRDFGSQTYFAAPGIASGSQQLHSGQVGVNFHF